MAFQLRSSAFSSWSRIPVAYTGEGRDVSPPLAWQDSPAATAEFALIVDDPDAPRPKPWVHWILYKIPAKVRALSEGDNVGALEGPNDFGRSGWGGPMPPPGHGMHHYHFKLYALSAPLELGPNATKEELVAAMRDKIAGEAELVGTYDRGAKARA